MRVTGREAAQQDPFRRTGRPERVLLLAVVLAASLHAASTVLRSSGADLLWADALYALTFVGAAVLCLGRARRQPRRRWAWRALAVALSTNVAGDVYYSLVLLRGDAAASPLVADGLWLAFYPAACAALVLFLRGSVERFVLTMWLDALISALGVAAVTYAVVIAPLLGNAAAGGAGPVAALTLTYPLADLLLLVVVAAAAVFSGLGSRMWSLLGAGFVAFAAADAWFAVRADGGDFATGTPLEAVWSLAAVLFALAAATTPGGATGSRTRPWWHVMVVPVTFAGGSLALLAYGQAYGEAGAVPRVSVLLAVASLVVGVVRANVNYWEACRLLESRVQAHTDELTGLRNRRGFSVDLERALRRHRQSGDPVAVLLIDLDRFKEINDALGHAVGDRLLALVGPRMAECLREHDVLARLGGDEFAVLLSTDADREAATGLAERIAAALTRPFELPDISLHVGASVGIALCPEHAADGEALLRHADVAMYDAKGNGGGFRTYDPRRDAHSRDRLQTIEQLRTAIHNGRLLVYYQPKVDLVTGQVLGVEALVRWLHPLRGLLVPEDFLPLAEQSGLMRPLTDYVLEQALGQLKAWRAQGWDLGVAVNVSASNLLDAGLPLQVAARLRKHGVPPSRLSLEITESSIMADPVRARQVVQNLHDHGVVVAVDDFGTGYSSLAYLRHLSVRELKLDRGFVRDVCRDSRASAIVRSTVDLAHSLGLHMVAEGVEDEEAARKLTEYGCDVAQGYHYSRPVPAEQLGDWLREHHHHMTRAAG